MGAINLSTFRKNLPIRIQMNMWNGRLDKFAEDINAGRKEIDFDVMLQKGIALQRPFVWTLKQKQELIFSILKGVKIANFTVVLYTPTKEERQNVIKVIDGKQRLSTILAYYNNQFPIEVEGVEYYYSTLPEDCKYVIASFDLNFDQTYEYYDDRISDKTLVAWFEQINFAGTKQDEEHLASLKQ